MKFILQFFILIICLFDSQPTFGQMAQYLSLENLKENPIALTPNNVLSLLQNDIIDSVQANTINNLIAAQHLITFYQLQGLACFDSLEVSQLSSISYIEAAFPIVKFAELIELNNYSGSLTLRTSLPILTWFDRELNTSSTQHYMGNDVALQQKFQIHCGDHFTFTLNSAKDRGEPVGIYSKLNGMDFLTATLLYSAKTPISKLALGAFQFQWGQGLQLWTSRAMGRSIDILQSVRMAQGLKSYNGFDEQRFLQGLGFQWNFSFHEIYGICSRKLIDVPTLQDSLALQYGSVNTNGLHRTAQEFQRKKQIQEQIVGLAWQYKKTALQIGSLLLYQRYSASSNTDSLGYHFLKYSSPFSFSAGFNLKGNFKQSYFFLELVQVYVNKQYLPRSNAAVIGALFHMHPKIQVGIHLRYYGPYYRSFYEQGFHVKNMANNEKGIFLNVTYQLRKKIKWQTFIDQYEFEFLTAKDFPEAHAFIRSQVIYTPRKTAQLWLNYQNSITRNESILSLEAQTIFMRKWTFNIGTQFSPSINDRKAFSIFFTMKYQRLGNPWRFNIHLGSFLIPSNMNPHYHMNYHIGFGSTTLQLAGQGYYIQFITEYKLNQKISIGFRMLWLSKTALYVLEQQSFLYQSMRQNLQFDLQLKYQF